MKETQTITCSDMTMTWELQNKKHWAHVLHVLFGIEPPPPTKNKKTNKQTNKQTNKKGSAVILGKGKN